MLELADTSPGLFQILDAKVKAIVSQEIDWLERYENTATGMKPARNTAEEEGRKYLTTANTELSLGLTPDDIAEIVSAAMKNKDSYDSQLGLQTAKKNAVELYFNNNVLKGKVKTLMEKAKQEGALEHSKSLQKMKDEAQQTAGKSKLSTEVNRRGVDAPKFNTHQSAAQATPEQRERRIQEIIKSTQEE
jgi:hypothetical protein